jgi:hypothetical protein
MGGLIMTETTIDPELLRQLNHAGPDEVISVSGTLQPPPGQKLIPPTEVQPIVHRMLQRVQDDVGIAPERVNLFKNVQSFAVAAAVPFIKELLRQPEIASLTANQQPEEMLIRPVSSQPVDLPPRGNRRRNR